MKRFEKLRELTRQDSRMGEEFYYHFYREFERTSGDMRDRFDRAYYYAFEHLTPCINEGELIVGSRNTHLSKSQLKEWQEKYSKMFSQLGSTEGQDSHMAIDYDTVLTLGLDGITEKIEEYQKTCPPEKNRFYEGCKNALRAVKNHSKNYAEYALSLAVAEKDAERKSELLEIARICQKVPARPAESFHEAVQSVHFITHCLSLDPRRPGCQQFQMGRPDRYLYKFYENDIKKGVITKDFAQLLLDLLAIQINMRVISGLSSGYMVGGTDQNGNIVANELTLMCMQVIEDVRLVYPAVGFCYVEGMDEKYLDKACELLSKGYSHPAIFGDATVIKGLEHYGVAPELRHDYTHSTCVEITPVGASNVWVASPYTNLAQLLLECLENDYDNLDGLINAMFDKIDFHIKRNFEDEKRKQILRNSACGNPLLSCFVKDCLKDGTDIENGGALYNWIMPSFVGMANLVDSIYAVKTLVFEQKRLTIPQFKKILDQNFENDEALRLYIINQIPKYGNDNDEIDRYFSLFSEHIIKECEKYNSIHKNGSLIPSVFCWIMHEWFGRQTGATPDGRVQGFPLGDGSGACQGRETCGPTASIISATKWEHHRLIGGVAVNLKFSKSALGERGADVIKAMAKTYIARGGFELQVNVVDNETLKDAVIHPENYTDLIVRIGGYSDYFVKLSPNMQQEVIQRTAHNG
ncbi:MAG: hypothetical protein KBS41_04640 [Oscillospiraceae bacterium]|nr:hypothetical protein [Candidatus Equicaccousia limihippi]